MRPKKQFAISSIWIGFLFCASAVSLAAVRYVNVNNSSPAAPYTNWSSAAKTIQDAIDAATIFDEIVVTNGVYDTGGRAVSNAFTNRVALNRPLYVHSVNGPAVTLIVGAQVPGTITGPAAVRCAYLMSGTTLAGFTLTNGATGSAGNPTSEQSGGGVWCQSTTALISNCVIVGNFASLQGGGAYQGSLRGCRLERNSAPYSGGGAYRANLTNCVLNGNSAGYGGGADESNLQTCVVASNLVVNSAASPIPAGGGAGDSTLIGCIITNNSSPYAGGAYNGTLLNCVLSGNSSTYTGGGVESCTVSNCTLTGNTSNTGGGAYSSTLANCTLTGNSAKTLGGGAYSGTLYNCILYHNSARLASNYFNGTLNYCCTTPLPAGPGNLDAEPDLASDSHLSIGSPCRGAGSSAYSKGKDLDGEPWANPPAIGCDELYTGTLTGAVSVAIEAPYANVAAGFNSPFTSHISGELAASFWDFGDGTVLSNRPYASHAWAQPGDYVVVLQAFNNDNPGGVSASVPVHVVTRPVHYVALTGTNPLPPFSTWATAATNIQDAVDVASAAGAQILVSNGVYQAGARVAGGKLRNRLVITKPLLVQSLNGASSTLIRGEQVPRAVDGEGAIRCVFLNADVALVGFTLTNGATRVEGDLVQDQCGGGVCTLSASATLSNCVISGNSAWGYGGGAYGGTLINCLLAGNSSRSSAGGGAYSAVLNNCTVTGNSSWSPPGGVGYSTINNSVLYFNSNSNYAGGSLSPLNFCCTTPLPSTGTGNIDAEPQLASASHLSAGSPCVGAGDAGFSGGADIDGQPWGVPPSMGCDEFYARAATGPLSVGIRADYTNVLGTSNVNFVAVIAGNASASRWEWDDGSVVSNRPYLARSWAQLGDHPVVLRAYNDSNPAGISATSSVHIVARPVHYVSLTNLSPLAPYTNWATAATNIQDAVDAAMVPGALVMVNDGTYRNGGTAAFGALSNRVSVTIPLALKSLNGPGVTVVEGYQAPGTINGDNAIRCVFLLDGSSLEGFTLANGATRAAGSAFFDQYGGGLWCASTAVRVTNCALVGNSAARGGGSMSGALFNCVLSNNAANLGGGAYSAVLNHCLATHNLGVTGGASFSSTLNDCTLTGNSATSQGGGDQQSLLNRCILSGNTAGSSGGAAAFSTLNDCLVSGNSAYFGGGLSGGAANGCTIVGNSAIGPSYPGGGTSATTLNNCIVYFNSAYSSPNYDGGTIKYSCVSPAAAGPGNISSDPLFIDRSVGNFRLQTNSPCINAGTNSFVTSATDLDGRPRIASAIADIGAYEFQPGVSGAFIAWLQSYGLPTDGSVDFLDSDGDRSSNWQEWVAGTDPTNASSAFLLLAPVTGASGVTMSWTSVSNRLYSLERATNLDFLPPFSVLRSNIPGLPGVTSFTDTDTTAGNLRLYRARVQQ